MVYKRGTMLGQVDFPINRRLTLEVCGLARQKNNGTIYRVKNQKKCKPSQERLYLRKHERTKAGMGPGNLKT